MALEFPIELEYRIVDFKGGRKTEEPERKTFGARTRTNNKLNPHWWDQNALSTAQPLLPPYIYLQHEAVLKTLLKFSDKGRDLE